MLIDIAIHICFIMIHQGLIPDRVVAVIASTMPFTYILASQPQPANICSFPVTAATTLKLSHGLHDNVVVLYDNSM